MKETIKLIEKVTEFAINPDVKSENKIKDLKQLLVSIYAKFLTIEKLDNDTNYKESYSLSYDEVKENVIENFPKLGYYNLVLDSHDVVYKKGESEPYVNLALGDPIDDICDILKDLLEVKWRYENYSKENANWSFMFLMKNHSEEHLVNLLKYLKDLEE
ncbi:DUF5063 domain-containing protein [Pontimicrobium sp. MEBiC01747]